MEKYHAPAGLFCAHGVYCVYGGARADRSMIVVTSLEDGVRLSRERLGADIMVLRPALQATLGGAVLRRAGERVSASFGRGGRGSH